MDSIVLKDVLFKHPLSDSFFDQIAHLPEFGKLLFVTTFEASRVFKRPVQAGSDAAELQPFGCAPNGPCTEIRLVVCSSNPSRKNLEHYALETLTGI
jgi:hypothetical protein